MKKILITGANGFIGQALIKNLFAKYKIIVFDKDISDIKECGIISIKGDILDAPLLKKICDTYVPDVVIHCAGIAHQSINSAMDKKLYDDVNHVATKNLAKSAGKANSKVHFIFLSSISVYGECHKHKEVTEEDRCCPTTEYARSKLDAEDGLKTFFKDGFIKKLDMLRLAPVYDSIWSLNLEKRVFGPQKIAYLRFGSGKQKMSVLARQNLVDFILYRIENNSKKKFCNVFNVTDKRPCSFNKIIEIFKRSEYQPDTRVFKVPLWFVWMATRLSGILIKGKVKLVHSFYDKLANDLIFDNTRMLNTGFDPKHTIKSVFIKQ